MPPKKKPQPKGPFFFFMLDVKKQYENQGRRFPNGIADVKDLASPLWEKLSDNEKAKYKARAEQEKGREKDQPYERYDSLGNPISQKVKALNEAEVRKKKMYDNITAEVKTLLSTGELPTKCFYFAHINYMVSTDEREYYPREIAIVKCSLKNGILDSYHTFVNPGPLRLGYSYEAKAYSERTHKIPTTDFDLARDDYFGIWSEIEQFLRQTDGSLAPLYFEMKEFEGYEYMLNFIIGHCPDMVPGLGEPGGVEIRHLNKLFRELRRQARPEDPFYGFPSETYAGDVLWKKEYDYNPELACRWHDEQDYPIHCSLSIARRFAYFVAEFCCPGYGLPLLPGRHFPSDVILDHVAPPEPQMQNERQSRVQQPPRAQQQPLSSVPKMPSATTSRLAARFGCEANAPAGRGASFVAGALNPPAATGMSFASAVSNGGGNLASQMQNLNIGSGYPGAPGGVASAPPARLPFGRGRGRGVWTGTNNL